MPASYGWEGLASGLAPFAQELFKSKLAERKPAAQLQRGLLDAIRSMSQAQGAPTTASLQAQADEAELKAALSQPTKASSEPAGRMDLNSVISGLAKGASPEMVGQANRGQGFFDALNKAGITSLGADSIGLRGGAGSSSGLYYFDPESKKFYDASGNEVSGNVARGSVVKSAATSVDFTRDKAYARGAGGAEGRLDVEGLDPLKANAITGNRAIVRSVGNIFKLMDEDPGLFERASTPGSRATMLGDEAVKQFNLWRENLINYKAFSEGGKQLTSTELARTIATLTSLIRGEAVSREALAEFKQRALENLSLIEGSWSKGKLGDGTTEGTTDPNNDPLGLF